jgi:hypothetical protein
MKTKVISTFYSDDLRKQVDIVEIGNGDIFALDYYYDKKYTNCKMLKECSIKEAELAAQEYVSENSI